MPSPSLAANVVGAAHANFSRGGGTQHEIFHTSLGGLGGPRYKRFHIYGQNSAPNTCAKDAKAKLLQQVAASD
jgi:hypothetical protein